MILAVVTSFISARIGSPKRFTREWWSNWIQGLSTELVGAAIATLLIGVVVGAVQKNEADELLKQQQIQADQNLKRELILQMGSPNNGFAIEAARQLEALGWLYDSSLQGAYLGFTNLQGAFLMNAKLQGANLIHAKLQDANLMEVNLQGANLMYANLQGAILWGMNLQGANLRDANLQDASLSLTKFNEFTILPDGTNWAPETDMTRFTDPNHPQFWRSNNLDSPAYGGDTTDG